MKVRYIDPLYNGERISKCCKIANKMIENNLAYSMDNYVYLDFNFEDEKEDKLVRKKE